VTEQFASDNGLRTAMLCQRCKKREALVHLSAGVSPSGRSRKAKHYCKHCADAYFARTPGMNSARDLVRLSNFYRTKLFDELESQYPEVFDNSSDEACLRGTRTMRHFLRKRLAADNVRLNSDGFEMLCNDLCFSHHFYDRAEKFRQKAKS
jgi:hypothetical protein